MSETCGAASPDGNHWCDLSPGHTNPHTAWETTLCWPISKEKEASTFPEIIRVANELNILTQDLRVRAALDKAHSEMVKQRDEQSTLRKDWMARAKNAEQEVSRLKTDLEAWRRQTAHDNEKIAKLRMQIGAQQNNQMIDYQAGTDEFAVYPGTGIDADRMPDARQSKVMPYLALGLTGEAGEVADIIKKILRNGESFVDNNADAHLREEIGDVLWYLARICQEKGWSLHTIGKENLAKLAQRKNRGELKERKSDRVDAAAERIQIRCVSIADLGDGAGVRCALPQWHEGSHNRGGMQWDDAQAEGASKP